MSVKKRGSADIIIDMAGKELQLIDQWFPYLSSKQRMGFSSPCPACSASAKSDRFRLDIRDGVFTGYFCGRGSGYSQKGNIIGLVSHLQGISYGVAAGEVDNKFLGNDGTTEIKRASSEEIEAMEARQLALKEKADKEDLRLQKIAAKQSKLLYKQTIQISKNNKYIARKNVVPVGLRQLERTLRINFFSKKKQEKSIMTFNGGSIFMPIFNKNREIVAAQVIDGRGGKMFIPNQKTKGNFGFVGKLINGAPLLIAEGLATALSLYEATGFPVVISLNSGNAPIVASLWAGMVGADNLMLCADNDKRNEDRIVNGRKLVNAGKNSIEECNKIGVAGIMPVFDGDYNTVDFNDVHKKLGIDGLKNMLRVLGM